MEDWNTKAKPQCHSNNRSYSMLQKPQRQRVSEKDTAVFSNDREQTVRTGSAHPAASTLQPQRKQCSRCLGE
ncbi:uncharacterized protein N7529_006540 [Penicillium soppii]|uniref:uncharacterized protein n=1 Tax=Penicillium soppii TaxID=69789 RepID=UPI002547DE46|nr:uncharacterized protein N7529_006540 [Penicillium soppii]KAJ5864624.1 hypothetical protein N7529_006540 [Penicillium soppii]